MAVSRRLDLKRAQVEAMLISMRNKDIQRNLPYVPPTDADVDNELASEQPLVNPQNNFIQTNLDEELSKEIMLIDEGKTVPDPNFMSSVRFQSKPSSSKTAFDFGSSSSTTPNDESNSNIKLHEDDATTQPSPSINPSSHQAKPQHSNSDSESSRV